MPDGSSAQLLRRRLAGGPLLVAPGVCDPYTARIVEDLGFEALYLGGNALGLQLGVGQPFVTLTETAAAVHAIARVAHSPVICDGGAGFGDAAHAAVAMRALRHAGAAAVHVDDQLYPKRAHYHKGRGRLAETEVVCGRLRAMRQAGDQLPLLIARTDAFRVTGSVDQVIERGRRYIDAGAEGLMPLDLPPAELAAVRAALPDVPLAWIGGIAEPVPTVAELQDAGFALAVYPFNTTAAITEAVTATWKNVAATGRPASGARPTAQLAREALELIGMPQAWLIESETTESDSSPPEKK